MLKVMSLNNFPMFCYWPTFSQQMCSSFSCYYFIVYIAPGGSVQEEGEKATWRTTVCVFEANDDELKTYVQVYCRLCYFSF